MPESLSNFKPQKKENWTILIVGEKRLNEYCPICEARKPVAILVITTASITVKCTECHKEFFYRRVILD